MKNNKYPYGIGPAGRWLIFGGLPLAIMAVFFAIVLPHHALEHAVGETLLPYVLAGVPSILMVAGALVFDRIPKALIIPLGIAGWIINVSVTCWYYWFGPGAFGHH